MGLRNSIAILLDVQDLQERDRIVTFLSPELGKKRGVARGSRAKYSRFAGMLQPLAKIDVRWFEKDTLDLVRISEVSLLRPAIKLHNDLEGILLGAYLADHMKTFAQENEDSIKLYRLLDSTLEALLAGLDRDLAARYYEVWMLRLAGIFPPPHGCPGCGGSLLERATFLDSESMLVCERCAAGRPGFEIGPAELEFLRRSARANLEKMAEEPPSKTTLRAIERLCGRVRRNFLQAELRSYRVMQEILASLEPSG